MTKYEDRRQKKYLDCLFKQGFNGSGRLKVYRIILCITVWKKQTQFRGDEYLTKTISSLLDFKMQS